MTKKKEIIDKCRELGASAFAAGRKAVPAQDKALMDLLDAITSDGSWIGTLVPLLDAWTTGWHTANSNAATKK